MRRSEAITGLLIALPSLLAALAGWLQADAKAREAQAAKKETARAYDSYGEYTTEQLLRDEALLKALRECQERARPPMWVAYSLDAERHTEPQAQVVLDEIAKAEGWKPEGVER